MSTSLGLRLIVWAPIYSPSTSELPTLDPDSLYAATLLQASRVSTFSLSPPSSLLHSRIPCLEEETTSVRLAEDIDAIESFARKHAGNGAGPSLLDEDDITGKNERASRRRWAKRRALDRYLLSTLHPLVYQTLFSPDVYPQHSLKLYIAGLSVLNRGSLITRLRKNLRTHYAIQGDLLDGGSDDSELAAILIENNTQKYLKEEDERERRALADRGGISVNEKKGPFDLGPRGGGLLQEEKAIAAKAFSDMRLRTYAEKLFEVFADALSTDEYFFASMKPSMVDLRLFSILAPLLLPTSSYPELAKSTLPTLLRTKFPALVSHTERVQQLVWPIEKRIREASTPDGQGVVRKTLVATPGWPSLPGREQDSTERLDSPPPLTIRVASTMGRICGSTYHYTSSVFSARSSTRSERTAKSAAPAAPSSSPPKKATTEAERKEARRVAIGRWVWISSAVIGLVGTALASGLVSIQYGADEEDGDEEDDDDDGGEEVVEDEATLEDTSIEVDEDEDDYQLEVIDVDEIDGEEVDEEAVEVDFEEEDEEE